MEENAEKVSIIGKVREKRKCREGKYNRECYRGKKMQRR